jgi:hypothetical protein
MAALNEGGVEAIITNRPQDLKELLTGGKQNG